MRGRKNMPNPKQPRDVHVSVTLNSETPGDFSIEPSPLGSLPTGPNGELIFNNAGRPGFFIHFGLVDKTGLNYKFPPQAKVSEAVWSELVAGACPQSPGKWDVFEPRNITNGGMTLIVHNPNVDPILGKFGYTLRVTKDGGATYLPLDPGGDNQNGPVNRYNWNTAVAFVSGAAVGSLATIGVQALLQQ
jgi:hypothetical protein